MSFLVPDTTTSSRRSERMVALLSILRDREEVQLRELAQLLGASAATIRRDVAALADQGLLVRTHGGARSAGVGAELPVNLRDGRHRAAKAAIARAVVSELPVGKHAISLTGGTTTAEVLRALHHRHDLTIVTNSVGIALEAAHQGQQRVLIAERDPAPQLTGAGRVAGRGHLQTDQCRHRDHWLRRAVGRRRSDNP